MEKQIKLKQSVKDRETGKQILAGTVTDLGEERNKNAVKAGLAVWVDSRSLKEEKPMAELSPTEKKEGTPKKTTTSARGKKIETKDGK